MNDLWRNIRQTQKKIQFVKSSSIVDMNVPNLNVTSKDFVL